MKRHPLIQAIIASGGIRPEHDRTTGKLADEFQYFKGHVGLLKNSGRTIDEWARTADEDPEIAQYMPGDLPEDFRQAVEDILIYQNKSPQIARMSAEVFTKENKESRLEFRVNGDDKEFLSSTAKNLGYKSISEFARAAMFSMAGQNESEVF